MSQTPPPLGLPSCSESVPEPEQQQQQQQQQQQDQPPRSSAVTLEPGGTFCEGEGEGEGDSGASTASPSSILQSEGSSLHGREDSGAASGSDLWSHSNVEGEGVGDEDGVGNAKALQVANNYCATSREDSDENSLASGIAGDFTPHLQLATPSHIQRHYDDFSRLTPPSRGWEDEVSKDWCRGGGAPSQEQPAALVQAFVEQTLVSLEEDKAALRKRVEKQFRELHSLLQEKEAQVTTAMELECAKKKKVLANSHRKYMNAFNEVDQETKSRELQTVQEVGSFKQEPSSEFAHIYHLVKAANLSCTSKAIPQKEFKQAPISRPSLAQSASSLSGLSSNLLGLCHLQINDDVNDDDPGFNHRNSLVESIASFAERNTHSMAEVRVASQTPGAASGYFPPSSFEMQPQESYITGKSDGGGGGGGDLHSQMGGGGFYRPRLADEKMFHHESHESNSIPSYEPWASGLKSDTSLKEATFKINNNMHAGIGASFSSAGNTMVGSLHVTGGNRFTGFAGYPPQPLDKFSSGPHQSNNPGDQHELHNRPISRLANNIYGINKVSGVPLQPGQQHPSYPPKSQIKRQKMIYHCKFGEFGVLEGQFTEPSGVAVNAQNDIIVADTNNHRIQIFDKEGRFKFQFGECGKRDGQLLYPNRVAVVRQSGDIVVTERSPTHQVQVYNQYGQFVRKFGASILQHPRGVCVDNKGLIVVVECKVMRVIIFDQMGNVLSKFGCSKHLEFPNGVVVNDRREIFISDNRAHCVKVFSYEGSYLRQIGGEGITNYPIGVGINATGEVTIADNHNNFNLSVFSQDGTLLSALESKVKHAQCFDVSLMDDGSVVLASKDYRLYIYRYVQIPPAIM